MPAHGLREDFNALFTAEFDFVWGSLRRLGVAPGDVDDVAQDVFVRVYRKLDTYDRARPVRPWLFAFAVRAASDYRRLARHRIEDTDGQPHEPPSNQVPPDEAARARERSLLVERALEAIPLERRAVLIAYELDEQPMKEIAHALGIPTFTAYSRLRVAREEFGAAVKRLVAKEAL